MGVKEYKYLTDALKSEILILRGDLKQSNLPIHIITDKRVLSFIGNDESEGNKSDDTKLESVTIESSKPSNESSSKGNIKIRKRVSLLNLDEEEMILKYCELRAKYDNLLFSSSSKIYELQSANDLKNDHVVDEEVQKQIVDKEKELNLKYQQVIDEKERIIMELRDQVKELTSENESKQELVNLNSETEAYLNEKLEKYSNNN